MRHVDDRAFLSLLQVAIFIGGALACAELPSGTESSQIHSLPAPRYVENSAGFFMGSDGYYHWDGQPPTGDLDPAEIYSATASGSAPRPGSHGWISGTMDFMGDQYKIDLSYSVDHEGTPYYSNVAFRLEVHQPVPLWEILADRAV